MDYYKELLLRQEEPDSEEWISAVDSLIRIVEKLQRENKRLDRGRLWSYIALRKRFKQVQVK